jgi:hypothetical protein
MLIPAASSANAAIAAPRVGQRLTSGRPGFCAMANNPRRLSAFFYFRTNVRIFSFAFILMS